MVQEKALALDELGHVLQIKQLELILDTWFSAGVPPFRFNSRLLLLLALTLASTTGTWIPRLVVIRVLVLRGAGMVPSVVLSPRMATATPVEVIPFRPLLIAQATGKPLALSDVRQWIALLEMKVRFPNALPLHRRPPPSPIAALLEQDIRLSILMDMTLLACIRVPTPSVPGIEPEAARVGGRSMTAFPVALEVPVMAQARVMGPAGIRCVATHMCPRSMRLIPTLELVGVSIAAMDSMLFTGLMLPASGLITVAPLVLSRVILPVVIGPVVLLAVGRILM